MARRDRHGVIIAAPIQVTNAATMSLPRLDEVHRGPAALNAYELSRCYIDLMERFRDWGRPLQIPDAIAKRACMIPAEGRREWAATQAAAERAKKLISDGMMTGTLPIWIATKDQGDRPVAPSALIEVGDATVVSGCYLPSHDRGWLYGRPLFVKDRDWLAFVDAVADEEGIGAAAADRQVPKGRPPVHDWDQIREFAVSALAEHPTLSRSKLADSLVAEYAEKVARSHPAKRTIERRLKKWGLGQTEILRRI